MQIMANTLKAATLSMALLAGTAVVATVAIPDVAYAGKGNGNSGGNGGGNSGGGHGNAGGDKADKGNGKSAGKSASSNRGRAKSETSRGPIRALSDMLKRKDRKAEAKVKRSAKPKTVTSRAPKVAAAPAPKPKGSPLAYELGVHPSELGALNAAHASPTALANASPNSRVGKLAIYMDEVEATRQLAAELDAAIAELEQLEEPTREVQEIDEAIATAKAEKLALEAEMAALAEQGGDVGTGDKSEIESDGMTSSVSTLESEIAALEQERRDAEAYATAQDEVTRLEGELETQSTDQRAALEAAANKEVTDEVEVAVQKLLGIYEEEPVEDAIEVIEETAALE